MPCYSPLTAYKCFSGEVVFSEHKTKGDYTDLQLPCGQCIGCRLERSRQWAMRCMHESQMHKENTWITLTYDEDHIPKRGLKKSDFQKFMKRLRKKYQKTIRYYMCGEYGTETGRPHFHACIFGHRFEDMLYYKKSESGENLYTSEQLGKIWTYGHAPIGEMTFESAAYTARYCMQRITGFNAKAHYTRTDEEGEYQLQPEYNDMSRKPGIGQGWYAKYKDDVYPHDYVVVNTHECKPPKFYDQQYEKQHPDEYEYLKEHRMAEARKRWEDNTPKRLTAKQTVTEAKLNFLKRNKS